MYIYVCVCVCVSVCVCVCLWACVSVFVRIHRYLMYIKLNLAWQDQIPIETTLHERSWEFLEEVNIRSPKESYKLILFLR